MMSPALRTTIVSPMAIPFSLMKSWLWSTARLTVVPASVIGSKTAVGVSEPGAPHADLDLAQGGPLLLGRVFEGDRPAGELGRRAKLFALCKVVDLDDRAVDVEGELVAVFADPPDLRDRVGNVGERLIGGDHLEAERRQVVERLLVAGEGLPLDPLDVEDEDIQPPLRGDAAVLLPQGARRRVARVFEGLLLVFELPGDHPVEARARHVDLPAHLEEGELFGEGHRDRPDRLEVLRDVLPGDAVPARRPAPEGAVPVFERDGQPSIFGSTM